MAISRVPQKPVKPAIQAATFPAPQGGRDARQKLAANNGGTCLYSYNREAAEKLGISARTIRNKLKKYREEGLIE